MQCATCGREGRREREMLISMSQRSKSLNETNVHWKLLLDVRVFVCALRMMRISEGADGSDGVLCTFHVEAFFFSL